MNEEEKKLTQEPAAHSMKLLDMNNAYKWIFQSLTIKFNHLLIASLESI